MLSNKPASGSAPQVIDRDGVRVLEFVRGGVQSAMDLRDPTRLVLAYTRAIMLFALFVPRPRHLLFVGLGGGSLVKFCYRHFPAARITVLEKRADVIALRARFRIPPDDARLRVLEGDATALMAQFVDEVDVLVIDGFDEHGLALPLCHPRFYANCARALRHGGLLVKNVFSYDRAYPLVLARLQLQFLGRVCWFRQVAGNNVILFAPKQDPKQALTRAARLTRWFGWRQGLGIGCLNRWLARAVVARLARRRSVEQAQGHPDQTGTGEGAQG
ncbi:transferase spermidine synthase [Massilia sp. TS11]|uniref:spermine/spermidine synthase domain-containing protein n=1 Tax=Massilia sp. TS11 TaxID=2908003 RepID=UPI001EDA551F|nr:transferase spermidine synthase [Massilia sp. TS11]MCG2584293.1 transferase spermidine synthase [Massilia sp. TS11]